MGRKNATTAPATEPPALNTPDTENAEANGPDATDQESMKENTFNAQPVEVVFDQAFEQLALKAAITAHHANQGYCLSIGDSSQLHWNTAPEWQRTSALKGARAILDGTITAPSGAHDAWMAEKLADGWKFGPVKDAVKKTHPCMVPHDQLSAEQQFKDTLFFAVVSSFKA